MARIRTIRPELWESQKVGKLNILSRLTFIGLISLADDEGRGRGDIQYLLCRLYAYDKNIKYDNLKQSLKDIEKIKLAVFYEVDESQYYYLPGWSDHQKINRRIPSMIPPPPTHCNTTHGSLSEDSVSTHGSLSEDSVITHGVVTAGKDRIGKDRIGYNNVPRNRDFEGFALFWATYPRRDGKQKAQDAWNKLKPTTELQRTIISDIKKKSESVAWRNETGKFIPLPASYLNGKRWQDEGIQLPPVNPSFDARTAAHIAEREKSLTK